MERKHRQSTVTYVVAGLVGLVVLAALTGGCNTQQKRESQLKADREYQQRVQAEEERVKALPKEQRDIIQALNGIGDFISEGVGKSLD